MTAAYVIAAAVASAVTIFWPWRDQRVRKRPLLLAALVIGCAGIVFSALVGLRWASESYFRCARYWPLMLGVAATVYVTWRLSRHARRQRRWRVHLSDALVGVLLISTTGAASECEVGRPLDRLAIVFLVDDSRSVDLVPNVRQRVQRELAAAETTMRKHDRVAVIRFGADAAIEQPLRVQRDRPSNQRASIARDGTDIAAALRLGLAERPADAATRLVLISDGVVTRGDAVSASAGAVAAGIPVDVLPLEQRTIDDVRVVALQAPSRARKGQTLPMRIVVASPKDTEIEVRLSRDGRLIRRVRARVRKGEDILRLEQELDQGGLHRYDVEITALDASTDAVADDNQASAFVRVAGQAKALIVTGSEPHGQFLQEALRTAGFVTRRGGAGQLPTTIAGMALYDLIVLGDIPASALDPEQISDLAAYVRDVGGGLLLMGGPRSMGPGGYALTPLEEISPVSFDLKQDKRRASLAEVIAIDISGSMSMRVGSNTKLELANEGAARSAMLLGSGDQLGVLHVDTKPLWTVPLAPVKDKKSLEKTIRLGQPGGGGIFVDVALREAYAALRPLQSNLKHVLLFADGGDAENITAPLLAEVKTAHDVQRITTSVVALGRGHDIGPLERLSRIGHGRFYIVENARRLPAVFTQETIAATRSAIVEETFSVIQSSEGAVLRGVTIGEAPALDGYVVTIPKGRSNILLRGPDRDPLLATWSVGLGRAAAFTSDMGLWASKWSTWKGSRRLFGQLARSLARGSEDQRVRVQSEIAGGRLFIRGSATDESGRAASLRQLVAHVRGPSGLSQELLLEPTSSGSYAATMPTHRPGAYVVAVRDEETGRVVATTGSVLSRGEELRPTGSDLALLDRLSTITGGKRRDTLAGIFTERAKPHFAYEALTTWLAVAAAVAMLLVVAVRRLGTSEWLEKAAGRLGSWQLARASSEAESGSLEGRGQTVKTLLHRRRQDPRHERETPATSSPRPVVTQANPVSHRGVQRTATTAPTSRSVSPTPEGPVAPPVSSSSPRGRAEKHLSAAEILLERRRKKRR